MKASELDKKFDDNQEDIIEHFDTSKIRMINEEPKRVNIDFPAWMVQSLDKEARRNSICRYNCCNLRWTINRIRLFICCLYA